jgi:hypothetical protein
MSNEANDTDVTSGSEESEVTITQSNVPALKEADLPNVLEGVSKASGMLDGNSHVSVAVRLKADDKPSALVIPDISKDKDRPVYLTKPITLDGEKFKAFLEKKITLPDRIGKLLKNIAISCNAFYYVSEHPPPKEAEKSTKPLLMMFSLSFKNAGLIESLSGDKDLGDLFDITGASVRIFRCPAESFKVLEDYAKSLSE